MTTEPNHSRALTGLAPRRSLGVDPGLALLRREGRTTSPRPAAVPPVEPETTDSGVGPSSPAESHARAGGAADLQTTSATDPVADTDGWQAGGVDLPPYLRLVRKEARIRSDQADLLAEHVRRLNQVRTHRRGVVGERITDNTLIRVAIDLLLDRVGSLHGVTEEELRRSVSQ